MRSVFTLFVTYLVASASALSSPPAGAITVGNGGKYATLSAALQDTSSLVCHYYAFVRTPLTVGRHLTLKIYFIYSGTYTDTAIITRAHVRVYGQTNTPNSYTGNTSTAGSNDASGTVQVHAGNVSLYNLNVANTYGKDVDQAQAIALSVQSGQFGAYGLKIMGDQDTLLANVGTWIEGAVDFIFGMRASIWITRSVINTIGNGYITASGRSSDDANWYVINNSTIQGTGKTYLGRPWRDYARVVFQNSILGSNVPAAGWSVWGSDNPQTDHVTFAEYGNTGSGASGTRASFSTQLSAPVSITTVLNSTSWIDSVFL
uniref:Pectinesterase n=1 Tax=Ganoderma boninense TaxID=34458 RepID=A0A5K1JS43_9APHY|nr:Pectinesterase (EC [Ganoderma boninense]